MKPVDEINGLVEKAKDVKLIAEKEIAEKFANEILMPIIELYASNGMRKMMFQKPKHINTKYLKDFIKENGYKISSSISSSYKIKW